MLSSPRSILLVSLLCSPAAWGIWPNPRSVQFGTTSLQLASNFTINLAITNVPSDLSDAVSRTMDFLQNDKLGRLVVGRGANDTALLASAHTLQRLTVTFNGTTIKSISSEAVADIASRVEDYTLIVPATGSDATLTAGSSLGLLRGLTTFSQLWFTTANVTYTLQAPVTIKDSPAFPYRGFMLDTARNFFPVADVKRVLDAMSWVKLNTLHWHVVDSQSFPLVVDGHPELSQLGAYSQSEIYSQADVQDITSFAAARGIDILLEIDTPGHTSAISKSHPELIACPEATPWSNFAAEPPSGQLRIASNTTISFIQSVFNAVSLRMPGGLLSSGGDEVNTECYADDSQTQASLKASGQTIEQALSTFVQQTHSVLIKNGKAPVVWEEMVLDHNITLSNNTVVMVWISSQNAAAVAKKGFRVVHAPSDFFYLDCGAGEWLGNNGLANSWCDPFKTWQKIYSFNPLTNISTAQQHLILGGQTLLWTEQTDPSNLDPIAWPRAAVAAEVFWTGNNGPNGSPRNVSEALPRLHEMRYRMVQRGVKAIPLQPQWCALRPGACDA